MLLPTCWNTTLEYQLYANHNTKGLGSLSNGLLLYVWITLCRHKKNQKEKGDLKFLGRLLKRLILQDSWKKVLGKDIVLRFML